MSSAAKDWVLETGPASPTENGEIEVGDKPEGASGNSGNQPRNEVEYHFLSGFGFAELRSFMSKSTLLGPRVWERLQRRREEFGE